MHSLFHPGSAVGVKIITLHPQVLIVQVRRALTGIPRLLLLTVTARTRVHALFAYQTECHQLAEYKALYSKEAMSRRPDDCCLCFQSTVVSTTTKKKRLMLLGDSAQAVRETIKSFYQERLLLPNFSFQEPQFH